jgi:pimeloyl-ACP methyl ester carboxylesterase
VCFCVWVDTVEHNPDLVARSREESARNPMYMIKVGGGADGGMVTWLPPPPAIAPPPHHHHYHSPVGLLVDAQAFYRQMQWRCREFFPAVSAPALVITGEADGLTPPARGAEVATLLASATAHVVPHASHQVGV